MQPLTHAERQAVARRLSRDRNPNHRPNKLTPEQKVEVVRRWMAGESMNAIARDYGITHQVVGYHVHRAARGVDV